jgi:hypothetical protein
MAWNVGLANMREDYQEALDKMFPDGYVIYYTCPNETVRIAKYNPLSGKGELWKNSILRDATDDTRHGVIRTENGII